jgi:hypothetical protein
LCRIVAEPGGDQRGGEVSALPDPDRAVVADGAVAGHGAVQAAGARVEDGAHREGAVDLHGDGGGVGGVAVHVVRGAVQRVDDPTHPALPVQQAALLGKQGVVGALEAQSLDDEKLRLSVHLAHHVRG